MQDGLDEVVFCEKWALVGPHNIPNRFVMAFRNDLQNALGASGPPWWRHAYEGFFIPYLFTDVRPEMKIVRKKVRATTCECVYTITMIFQALKKKYL